MSIIDGVVEPVEPGEIFKADNTEEQPSEDLSSGSTSAGACNIDINSSGASGEGIKSFLSPHRREPTRTVKRGVSAMSAITAYKAVVVSAHPETGCIAFVSTHWELYQYQIGRPVRPLPGFGPLTLFPDLESARVFGQSVAANFAVLKCTGFDVIIDDGELRCFAPGFCKWMRDNVWEIHSDAILAREVQPKRIEYFHQSTGLDPFMWVTDDGSPHPSLDAALRWMGKKRLSQPPRNIYRDPACKPEQLWRVPGYAHPVIATSRRDLPSTAELWSEYVKRSDPC